MFEEIVTLIEEVIKRQFYTPVRGCVEKTQNGMLETEDKKPVLPARRKYNKARQDTELSHWTLRS